MADAKTPDCGCKGKGRKIQPPADDSDVPEELKKLFKEIDANKEKYIDLLREAVAIESVSASPSNRNDVIKMVEWTEEKLQALGVKTEKKDLGTQKSVVDGSDLPLPPVLFGVLGEDPDKKTVLVYGHLDVQPAAKEDGWDTDPFVLIEKDGKLFGRGSTDDKGPVLGWLNAIQAYQSLGIDLPCNIRFVFEGMEESGSVGLDELLLDPDTADFLQPSDYVCISDNYWLGTEKPCITYGLRGICYFTVQVECANMDLHSGIFGGTVHEAMADLIYLLDSLITQDLEILIPGLMDDVAPLEDAERDMYENITFDVNEYQTGIGTSQLAHNSVKIDLLLHRWRYPSLSIHGIEGAFSEPGQKTVIPRKVIGKFSIRIVPNMTLEQVEKVVVDYLTDVWNKRGSANKFNISLAHGGSPWTEDPNHPHYNAGKKAIKHVYKVDPDMIREGGSIPVTLTLQKATGKNVILLPLGCGDDGAHSQNEKINVRNYIEGTKLLGAYLWEVSKLE